MRPDEEVAGELERSAGRAQARGGLAAAAAFLERAAELTPDPGNRARRALDAAQAKLQAGAFDSARALLAIAEEGPDDAFRRARIDLVRAQIAFASHHGSEAAPLLLAAARRFEPLDIGLARATYLEAFSAAMFAGRLAGGVGPQDVARAAGRAAQPPERMTADLLLDSLVVLFTEGYAAAMPLLKSTLRAFCAEDSSGDEDRRWLWFAIGSLRPVSGTTRASTSSAPVGWTAHGSRAHSTSSSSRSTCACSSTCSRASSPRPPLLVEEIETVSEATGTKLAPYHALGLAASRGHEGDAEAAIAASTDEVVARGEGAGLSITQWAAALLYNGLGRYEDAVAAARQAAEFEFGLANWGLAELVEAAARSDRRELAVDAVDQLADMAGASGTDWALGVLARSRALVTDGDAAEPLYREAIERLDRTRVRMELARAHLLYGEWLRRRAAARGRPRAPADRPRHVRPVRGAGVRRTGPTGAAGDGRDGAQAQRRGARRPHRAGGAGRPARGRRPYQPRDRRPAVHQPPHRGVPPAQGVYQAGGRLS